jgi:hypothetical protein
MTALDTLKKVKRSFDRPGAMEKLARIRLTQVYVMATLAMFPVLNVVYNPDGRYMSNTSITPQWRCSKCGEIITSALPGVGDPVGIHVCRHGFSFSRALAQADGLITKGDTCLLCGSFWGAAHTHTCEHVFLNSFGYDLTDVLTVAGQIIKGVSVSQIFLKLFRTTPFNIVVINREVVKGLSVLTRFHGYISKSLMANAGWALFSTCHLEEGKDIGVFDGKNPLLGGLHIVPYIGELLSMVPDNDDDLACHILKDDNGDIINVVDPTRLGGVAILSNNKHFGEPVEPVDYPDRMVLVIKRSVNPHEEICWNYNAVTDNKDEAQIMCSCGCHGPLMRFVDDVHTDDV